PAELTPSPKPAPDPVLSSALAALVPLDKGRPIDMWIGSAPAANGRTEVQIAWEALARAREARASVLEVEPVARENGASLGAPQSIAATGGNPTSSAARFLLEPGSGWC